jgi:triosephosphate isomerase (TIM)
MNKLIIANWKMQILHQEARSWLASHFHELEKVSAQTGNKLVICPSFTELSLFGSFAPHNITLGAQDCSYEERGAFTGDVSILSLKQLNCSYVIIGHSERRSLYGDTDERIRKKTSLALKHAIQPVICMGETRKERDAGDTYLVLEKQLTSIMDLYKPLQAVKVEAASSQKPQLQVAYEPVWPVGTGTPPNPKANNDPWLNPQLHIAYEPVWAIGTGTPASKEEIEQVCTWIREYVKKSINQPCTVLYGGSVNPDGMSEIPLNCLDGLLLGRASIDAQVLKKIILSC